MRKSDDARFSDEVFRHTFVGNTDYRMRCLGPCDREFVLKYNGGELDRHECCGYVYQFDCVQLDVCARRP